MFIKNKNGKIIFTKVSERPTSLILTNDDF